MKIIKIVLLTGLVISALPTFAHTHEELAAEVKIAKQTNNALKEALNEANKTIAAKAELNEQLTAQVRNSWGWKKKAGTFVAGLVIGWIVTVQGGKPASSGIPGATTGKLTL